MERTHPALGVNIHLPAVVNTQAQGGSGSLQAVVTLASIDKVSTKEGVHLIQTKSGRDKKRGDGGSLLSPGLKRDTILGLVLGICRPCDSLESRKS